MGCCEVGVLAYKLGADLDSVTWDGSERIPGCSDFLFTRQVPSNASQLRTVLQQRACICANQSRVEEDGRMVLRKLFPVKPW